MNGQTYSQDTCEEKATTSLTQVSTRTSHAPVRLGSTALVAAVALKFNQVNIKTLWMLARRTG